MRLGRDPFDVVFALLMGSTLLGSALGGYGDARLAELGLAARVPLVFVGALVGAVAAVWMAWRSHAPSPRAAPAPAPAPQPEPQATPEPIRVDLEGQLLLGEHLLHDGAPVEVLLPAGAWLAGELRREPEGWPALWLVLGGPWEHANNGGRLRRPQLAARVSPDALFRRPPQDLTES